MDTEETLRALTKQRDRAMALLKQQPLEKELCQKWTEETRKLLCEIYGPSSPQYRDFVAANRKIFTSFETDPSYYLTQVGANLRREIKILQRCIKQREDQLAAEEALAVVKRGKKKEEPRFGAVLWAENAAGRGKLTSFLESKRFKVTRLPQGKKKSDALWEVVAQTDLRYGVVIVSPQRGGAKTERRPSLDGLFAAGYLAGRLGRSRVLLIVPEGIRLPQTAGFLRAIPLEQEALWQKEIETDAGKLA